MIKMLVVYHLQLHMSQLLLTAYLGRTIIGEQFPLVPCWATTIHKVQGTTLKEAVLSLGNTVFEEGIGYVSLSQVSILQGLHLIALTPKKSRHLMLH